MHAVPLREEQRTRLANAQTELHDAVRSRQQTSELNGRSGPERTAFINAPSAANDIAGILKLELDVRKYVIEEINVLAEAAWKVPCLERFTEHLNNCAAEAIEHGLAMLDPRDRRDVNRTMLENIASAVVYRWTTINAPSGAHQSGPAQSTGNPYRAVIQLPREGSVPGLRSALPFRDYPRHKYSWHGKAALVKSLDEEKALGPGWANDAAQFAPYETPKRAKIQNADPLKWVDGWNIANLSAETRRAIKAAILKADAKFWRNPDAPEADFDAMDSAFNGIARALFHKRILTEQILVTEIPLLVWDSAIAGDWWYLAAERRTEIFPYRMGHYWVWLEEDRNWQGLFHSEIQHWRAELLETFDKLPEVSHEANNDKKPDASQEVQAEIARSGQRDSVTDQSEATKPLPESEERKIAPASKNPQKLPKQKSGLPIGGKNDEQNKCRGLTRSAWLDSRRADKGWTSDLDIVGGGGPTYNTIQRYRSGAKSTRDPYVRSLFAKALGCPIAEVPE